MSHTIAMPFSPHPPSQEIAELLVDADMTPPSARAYRTSTSSAGITRRLRPQIDPTITYLQVLYPFPNQLDLVEKIHARFGDELPAHLEFVRFDGKVTCFGLPLVRFTTEERLDEIIRTHEQMGAPVFNPHRYTLEEGGMKQTDALQLAFKREADPKGLLNPGKMIAWDGPNYDYRAAPISSAACKRWSKLSTCAAADWTSCLHPDPANARLLTPAEGGPGRPMVASIETGAAMSAIQAAPMPPEQPLRRACDHTRFTPLARDRLASP